MKFPASFFIALLSCVSINAIANPDAVRCPLSAEPVLQILGSGGPIADDGRASTGYVIWMNGKSRFLIDAGGGVFLRFGESGAQFEDLKHIAISHFHTDHSTDLVALLKSGYFSGRKDKLSISGPAAGGTYPGMDGFLKSLLDSKTGAYAYLNGYLDGSDGLVRLESININPKRVEASRVYMDPVADMEILALGVPHGPVPTLAYRVRIGQQSIVFSGDQNGSSEAFTEFARDTDVLVMHMPVPENITGTGRKLHAPPSVIGKIATEAAVGKLVLSHFMARSLANMDENLNEVRTRYAGSVVDARDLDCIEF